MEKSKSVTSPNQSREKTKIAYLRPELEVCDVLVEKGFAGSNNIDSLTEGDGFGSDDWAPEEE